MTKSVFGTDMSVLRKSFESLPKHRTPPKLAADMAARELLSLAYTKVATGPLPSHEAMRVTAGIDAALGWLGVYEGKS